MLGVRAVLASMAVISTAASVVIVCSIAPSAEAANSSTVEAESMSRTGSGTSIVRDSTASGGMALQMQATSAAATTLNLPAVASLIVRAKGQQCRGAPTMNVAFDGKAVWSTTVSSTSWTNYSVPTGIPAGSHTITISYPNPNRLFFCTRTLLLDSITVVVSASTTTTTTPTQTTTPTSTTNTSDPGSPPTGDATAWLQSKFDALTSGATLTLSPGTYQHSGVLKIRVAGARIEGNGATLQATNDSTSAVQILADNVSMSNLNLTAPLTGSRYSTADQAKLYIHSAGVTVSDVNVTGSAAAGVVLDGASNFTLSRVTVSSTRADGFHITNGTNNGQINNSVAQSTGDDGFAVVSYGDQPICHDIVVNSPTVKVTTGGRGLSVVGGQNISYRNISVSQSWAAAVYIAIEGDPWNTQSVNKVDVTGGTITQGNTSTQVVHGAVLVYSGRSGQTASNVTVSGLTIANTPSTALRNVAILAESGASVSGITLTNIALQNTQAVPFVKSSNVPAGSYTTSGWTLNGQPITVQ